MNSTILILVVIVFFSTSCSEQKKQKANVEEELNISEEYLAKINEELINKTITAKKDKKINTNYALSVEGKGISKEIFEAEYNKFIKETNTDIDKTNFVFIFLQDYFLLPKANEYFEQVNIKDFIVKQIVIQNFMKDKLIEYRKNVKVDETELSTFYRYITKRKEYRNLSLNKDRKQIVSLYKISKANQRYVQFEQNIKGRYSVTSNDEWEKSIIEKYKTNSFDRRKALSTKEYKNYWLYKISYGNKKRTKLLTVRDIERKIRLSKKLKSPSIRISIPQNKGVLLDRFLTEELIYLYMQNKKLIKKYSNAIEPLLKQFVIDYYLRKKLGLETKEKQKKYIEDFVNSRQIKLNDVYFD